MLPAYRLTITCLLWPLIGHTLLAGEPLSWLGQLAWASQVSTASQAVFAKSMADSEAAWRAPLDQSSWTAHHDWLANPAAAGSYQVEQQPAGTVFRVHRSGSGMKWSWTLPKAASLQGKQFASIRYRTVGWRPYSDYAVCAIGQLRNSSAEDYAPLIPAADLISDGRWHTLNVDIRQLANRFANVSRVAVQLQADASEAYLELAELRLDHTRQRNRLADMVQWTEEVNFDGFQPINLATVAQDRSTDWQTRLRLTHWFDQPRLTLEGIPFALLENDHDVAATTVPDKMDLRLPVGRATNEIYLLLLASMQGPEEPAYGQGQLVHLQDVDRFRLRLEYADESIDECLPLNVATRRFGISRGVQVVTAAADPTKQLVAITLRDACRQAAFGIAAGTIRTDGPPAFPETRQEHASYTDLTSRSQDVQTEHIPTQLKATFSDDSPLVMTRLQSGPNAWNLLTEPCELIALRVDGRRIAHDRLEPADRHATVNLATDLMWFKVRGTDRLLLGYQSCLVGKASYRMTAAVHNGGTESYNVSLTSPNLGPYRLCDRAEEAFYLLPRRGSVLDNRPCSYRERYCGLFPVQFLDTFSPAAQRGLSLRTEDRVCLRKNYLLEKEDGQFMVGVEYPTQTLAPGSTFQTAPAVITATDGDWHHGLMGYRKWLKSWYQPQSPRKPWFREIFNFRQRFFWIFDPAYDARTGQFKLQEAITEAEREFGGIDYLHLFDWGNRSPYGRIYGRTGDYSPYPMFQGGRAALRQAISDVQDQGVPVGLYIEGYLLQERGKLGQQHGAEWQLIDANGQGKYWPQSTEMFVCPAVDAWQQVQASTYATKVQELDVDGMYIDQFGFANGDKDCHATDHQHPVPSYAVNTEQQCTQIIRSAVDEAKSQVATYTEETPVDVTSQYQDGSFSYAMFSAQRSRSLVPLNLARFALPDFKTIQILFCDKPTGSWATGVRWVFFNGEAIWLEGKADEWFEPETRAEIRRCYAILHQHRDAFTTLNPEPLVPTEQGGLFANRFPLEDKQAITLYNANHRTIRGPLLRFPHRSDTSYHDAWHQRPADVRRDGNLDIVHGEVGPHGVGCIIMK